MTAHVDPGRSKSITLVAAAAITVVLGASLAMVLCQIAGFFFYDLVSAPKAGAPNRLDSVVRRCWPDFPGFSLHLPLPGGRRLHLHHWLYLVLAIAALIASVDPSKVRSWAMWFMLGGAVQGIYAYPEDWYKVFYPPPR
jgi:hypothetical protein